MNKNEVWKTYPEFDFIQGSNLGRARTIDRVVSTKRGPRVVKGRILTQHSNGTGYLQVDPRINGRKIHIYIHRLVAGCFLPNPENLPEINHKDNNPLNNNISNLEWCSRKFNVMYREKFGTPAKESVPKVPVYAVELKTQKVLWFESQKEAERSLRVAQQSISAVIKGKLKTAGGYWFTEDEIEITKEKLQEIKSNMLFRGGAIAIDVEEQEPLYFESQHEAARRLGFGLSNVSGVIACRQKTAHGYWFVRADSSAVEKTKAKFGDEVARKVEQLMSEKDYN